jgi:hypothetical protein
MLEIDRQIEQSVTFGPSIKVSTFLARNISEGNVYSLSPVKASHALRFLQNPYERPRSRKLLEENPDQLTVFDNHTLKELKEQGIDLPIRVYKWLNSAIPTRENTTERIRQELTEDDLEYSVGISQYFEKVCTLGEHTDLSNKKYGINLSSLMGGFNIEGERKTSSINLAGRFDEVRRDPLNNDHIIRIRQLAGRPTTTDAIYLGLDHIAHLAVNKKRGSKPLEPRLSLFNLLDGNFYDLKISSPRFFREIVNALIFSDLSLEAGYFPKDYDGFVKVNNALDKRVFLTTNKNRKQKYTAEEIFEKAKNCIKRLRGELPHSRPLFHFVRVDSKDGSPTLS